MLRRPNRASWHEESAGSPSPLARLLATPQPVRSVHADNSFVGARHALPGQIGFGPTHQHPVEGTAFTGGRVANPQAGLVHSQQMPSFSQANSHAGSSVAASLAALGLLAGTPHGGAATPTLAPGPGTSQQATGAIAPRRVEPPQPPSQGAPLGTQIFNPQVLAQGAANAGTYNGNDLNSHVVFNNGSTPTPFAFMPSDQSATPNLGALLSAIGKRGVFNV